MNKATLEQSKRMLIDVLGGATYSAAGAPFGIGRSSVERQIKRLVSRVARQIGIEGMQEYAVTSLHKLRAHRESVVRSVALYSGTSPPPRRRSIALLTSIDVDAGAERVRFHSDCPSRDVAMIYLLFCTGAKPLEIARLEVRDYLNADGSTRAASEMRAEAAIGAKPRPLHFQTERLQRALDLYLAERACGCVSARTSSTYRGLDPTSALFLTGQGHPFEIVRPTPNRTTCRGITEAYKAIFNRAGWRGMTTGCARRFVAARLHVRGAEDDQIGEFLGLRSARAVKALLERPRIPIAELATEIL